MLLIIGQRHAPGETRLDLVPPGDVWLAQPPAEVDRMAIAQRGEVYQASVKVFDDDASFAERPRQARDLPLGGEALALMDAQLLRRHMSIAEHLRPVSRQRLVMGALLLAQPLDLMEHRRDARQHRLRFGAGKVVWHGSSCRSNSPDVSEPPATALRVFEPRAADEPLCGYAR